MLLSAWVCLCMWVLLCARGCLLIRTQCNYSNRSPSHSSSSTQQYNSSRRTAAAVLEGFLLRLRQSRCLCVCAVLARISNQAHIFTSNAKYRSSCFTCTCVYTYNDTHMYHRNGCVSPFQLATPPGFQVNNIPKGNLVLHTHVF